MLLNLHVKNLALIKEIDVDFGKGLLVLTGETGAGKSLILGSVNIALGNKVSKEMIRKGAEYALVELTFSADDKCRRKLKEYDIYMEDDTVTVSRKITEGRSVSKINGETVNVGILKSVMSLLVDIHGQHDHQSLLYKNKHLEILDKFSKEESQNILTEMNKKYHIYMDKISQLKSFEIDDTHRMRELEFAKFEVDEINMAVLLTDEDLKLEEEFKILSNGQTIINNLTNIYNFLSGQSGIIDLLGRSVSDINEVSEFEHSISSFGDQLYNLESMSQDLSRELYGYIDALNSNPFRLKEVEERLDTINHLKMKYGSNIADIIAYRDEKQNRIDELENYNENIKKIEKEIKQYEAELINLCEQLSSVRSKSAKKLEKLIIEALLDLNFLQVKFEIKISKKENITEKGYDDVEFMISTNPGEPVRPLAKVASGGELSRIMLAIKSILASEDEVGTLIFDEIDTGISGMTAQKVAERLAIISKGKVSSSQQTDAEEQNKCSSYSLNGAQCQIICISHLSQIAAMADSHYLIEKSVKNDETFTYIKELSTEESIDELVRISGGTKITEAARIHAREMKDMADRTK